MTQLAFNSFLVAMLSVPVVTLISRRWTKACALPPVLLMGSLAAGVAVAAVGFWGGKGLRWMFLKWHRSHSHSAWIG